MLAFTGSRAAISEMLSPDDPQTLSILEGGLLYDNWFSTLGVDKPADTHSAWPASNTKKKGNVTWRCKSCHGWDYMGAAGAYGGGSYKTGIKGIRAYDGGDPAAVAKILRGSLHGYTAAMIPNAAIDKLALFVTKGQINHDTYIDRKSKKAKGNAAKGKTIFMTTCNRCHGDDGKMMNFKTADNPEFLGTLANGNPWEAINKIRHGQPDSSMPALGFMDTQSLADVLAYIQTLPKM